MYTLRQYLTTLSDTRGLTRTLGEIDLCRDAQGRPLCTAGNSAAVFRIRLGGRIRTLRCFLREMRHLREIYGDRLLEKELFLFDTPDSGSWADVVLGDWIEGETLQTVLTAAAGTGDRPRLAALAADFDRLAAQLTADDRAHGDLKPENIIVGADGTLHLIDLDAMFLPAFAGERSSELGTAAYQHPARTADDFDDRLDDYPAALISTALHALALDPTFYDRYAEGDGLLFQPHAIPGDAAYREVLTLFCRRGMAVQYRIAGLLTAPAPHLFGLPDLFARAAAEQVAAASAPEETAPKETAPKEIASGEATPELFVENGRWGYRTPQRIVVPPLYDCGFDFSEGLAAVQLGPAWHYIDTAGRTVLCCPDYDAVKPFRSGRAQVSCAGRRMEIDRSGREFDI